MDTASAAHWKYWAERDGVSKTCRNVCEFTYIPELFECSSCGKRVRLLDIDTDEEIFANYCPNCGARVAGD